MKKSAALLGIVCFSSASFASSGEADFMSGSGYKLFLAYGVFHSFQLSKDEGLRSLDSIVSSALLVQGLKSATHQPGPGGFGHSAFPSGHTAMAFTVATFEAETHPKEAIWWYLGAGLVGQSRLELKAHTISEVLAGAAVGYFTSNAERRSKTGFIIQPTPSGATVLGVSVRF